MSIAGFPTSSDIYLEVNGVKAAVVQSYTARASKTSRAVEAFGEEEPVATVPGQTTHVLELTRLYATDEAIRDGSLIPLSSVRQSRRAKIDPSTAYTSVSSRFPATMVTFSRTISPRVPVSWMPLHWQLE